MPFFFLLQIDYCWSPKTTCSRSSSRQEQIYALSCTWQTHTTWRSTNSSMIYTENVLSLIASECLHKIMASMIDLFTFRWYCLWSFGQNVVLIHPMTGILRIFVFCIREKFILKNVFDFFSHAIFWRVCPHWR